MGRIVLYINYQMQTAKPTKLLLECMQGHIHGKHAVVLHEGML